MLSLFYFFNAIKAPSWKIKKNRVKKLHKSYNDIGDVFKKKLIYLEVLPFL